MLHLLTFRHLREIKSAQGKCDYQRKEKESNEGDLIVKGKKKREMREILLSKHMQYLSLIRTHHPAEREGAQKTV